MPNKNEKLNKVPSLEFNLLATTAAFLKDDFLKARTDWVGSPFEWVLSLSPGAKGKFGKQLVMQWLAAKGMSVKYTANDSEADMLVNNHRVEVKFSTLWQSGIYTFQQIRDQNYDYMICIGLSPFDAHCWIIDKPTLKSHVIGVLGQHTGASGKDTSWIHVDPTNPPSWMKDLGGSLAAAFEILNHRGFK